MAEDESVRPDGAEGAAERFELTLEGFLVEEYKLFAVMGIFGALAAYLTSLADSVPADATVRPVLGLGAVASLLVFVLIATRIDLKFRRTFDNWRHFVFYLLFHRNITLATFLFSFNVAVVTIAAAALSFERAGLVALGLLLFLLAFYLTFELPYRLGELLFEEFTEPGAQEVGYVLLFSGAVVLAAVGSVHYLDTSANLHPLELYRSNHLFLVGLGAMAGAVVEVVLVLLIVFVEPVIARFTC